MANTQSVAVTFDHTQLSIPRKYLLPPFPSTLIPSQGMDKEVGVLLEIPLKDFGYPLERKIGFRYELTFLVTPLSVHHSPRLPPSGLDAWKGSGLYQERLIEFDQVTRLYRIYDAKYRKSWQFFKSSPNSSKWPEEEWVARCQIRFSEKDLSNLSSVTCKTVFLYQDIHIQMTLSGMYINLIEELKDRVKKLFSQWEVHKSSESKK